jgi:hypothetical protein
MRLVIAKNQKLSGTGLKRDEIASVDSDRRGAVR